MTREEAIKTIRELKRETNDSWYEDVYDMAIEALKEQKTSQLITNGIGVRYCSNCRRIDNKYSVYER